MKHHLAKQGDDVVVSFEQLGGHARKVIDAIVRCRASGTACPAGVCIKIDGMGPCSTGDALGVRLTPRGETVLDVASLGECLKYHLAKDLGR